MFCKVAQFLLVRSCTASGDRQGRRQTCGTGLSWPLVGDGQEVGASVAASADLGEDRHILQWSRRGEKDKPQLW